MKLQTFTEREFVRLLDAGEAPAWFKGDKMVSPDAAERRGSHNDVLGLDHLTKEFVLRELGSLFGQRSIPKKYRAGLTYWILELAEVQGLVVEQEPIGNRRRFQSTERMARYWSRMFSGESVPLSDEQEIN